MGSVAHGASLRTDMATRAAFSTLLLAVSLVIAQNSVSEDCFLGEECIGIRSCSAIVEQLQRAKATQDSAKRNEIIQAVRDKVCGKRKERRFAVLLSNHKNNKQSRPLQLLQSSRRRSALLQ